MRKLIDGVREYVGSVHGAERELFEKLARGQSPEAMFITCSDSRVSPALITQTRPGDLFVLRNAGNIVPPGGEPGAEAATIEYAVRVLGVRDLVICGHSDCGAMRAVVDPSGLENLPAVRDWLAHAREARRVVEESYADASPDAKLDAAIEANVLAQVAHLDSHPSVAEARAAGDLRLHAWVYRIPTGRVRAFDTDTGTFRDLLEAEPA